MRPLVRFCVFGVLLSLCGAARAGPAPWRLGERWEPAIEAGVAAQRSLLARGGRADTLVDRARRAVRREASVAQLYLLARAYGVRAQVQASAGDRASARTTYGEVLQKAPRCYYAHHDLGVLTLQADARATRAALGHFERAGRINPRYPPTLRQLVRLHLAAGRHAEAVPLLERLRTLEPADEEARARLATSYAALGRHAQAEHEFDALLERSKSAVRWRVLRAQTDLQHGRPRRALSTWKQLARANPNAPAPFLGMLACLGALQRAQRPVPQAEHLYALKGLKRLERDSGRRAQLARDIARIEHRLAAPPASGADRSAEIQHALQSPEESVRVRALLRVLLSTSAPETSVVRAVARHAVPGAERSAAVRAGAVRALGRIGGTRLVPLLRHALDDPDVRVGLEAADTLLAVARRDPPATDAVLAILGTRVDGGPAELAAAVRQCVLSLTGTTLSGVDGDSDATSWRAAFLTWWRGSEGVDLQVRALDRYHRLGDEAADQVLVRYLGSPDFFVFRAACRALRRARPARASGAWATWWAALPKFAEGRLKKEHWASLRGEMEAWVKGRPRR